MSLIDSTEGLVYGRGLYFEPGLGGAGLINPPEGPVNETFAGQGSMRVTTIQHAHISVRFAGSGGLRE